MVLSAEQLREVEALAYDDATLDDIAAYLGMSTTWLWQLSKDQRNAVQLIQQRGKVKSRLKANHVLNQLIEARDMTAVQYYLKREENRIIRRERREERKEEGNKPRTEIHVAASTQTDNKPTVVISIPSNGREIVDE